MMFIVNKGDSLKYVEKLCVLYMIRAIVRYFKCDRSMLEFFAVTDDAGNV